MFFGLFLLVSVSSAHLRPNLVDNLHLAFSQDDGTVPQDFSTRQSYFERPQRILAFKAIACHLLPFKQAFGPSTQFLLPPRVAQTFLIETFYDAYQYEKFIKRNPLFSRNSVQFLVPKFKFEIHQI